MVDWPSRELINAHMPKGFKDHFPNTRVIIDCTEFFIENPQNLNAQAATYSTYKSHNTYKALVGITPSGSFSYVSKL